MKNTQAKNHKEMYLNSICAAGAGSTSSSCNDTTQRQKNSIGTPTIALPLKSRELRKAEAGNSDLVLHLEGICLSVAWCIYGRQQY